MQGGGNMQNMLKQAQKMQRDMAKMQEELAEKTLEVSAGGGAVKVTVTGEKKLTALSISPDVIDPDDKEMLEDLVLSAVNEAMRQMDEAVAGQMSKLTGGMNIPGLF